ncbi:MAG TPA: P-loop NTPase fold protein [Burkholderiaceae bacterium]|nr:P-loop NTPase fold protein [Burkholderiaceae bacterium]
MNTTSDPNSHVTDAINSYLNLSIAPYYALMLDGSWGSGKTHYIKQAIKRIESESRKVIHISLYGLTNSTQIDNIIFQNLHPFLSSQKTKTAVKLLTSVASVAFKYDFSSGDADGEVKVAIPKFDATEFLSKEVDHIMFFDDFERCGIEPRLLLGYINYFIEHVGLKVIIAVNEKEISEASKNEYSKIKEKVVGVTYNVSPNVDSALKSFIDELSPKTYIDQISNNFDLIKNIFIEVDYSNLRSLRQVLIQFQSIYMLLPEKAKNNQEYFSEFINLYFTIALENSYHILNEDELIAIIDGKSVLDYIRESNGSKSNNNEKTRKEGLIKKYYTLRNLNIAHQSVDFWCDLFIKKYINVNLLNSLVDSHHLFVKASHNIPNWKKLWWWYKLKQFEYDEIVSQIEVELDNNTLGNIFEVLHACTLIASLITKNYYKKYDLATWILKSKVYFEQLSGVNQIPISSDYRKYSLDFRHGYAGLGYEDKESYFNEFSKFAKTAAERELDRVSRTKSVELIDALNISIEKFAKYIDDAVSTYPRFSIFDNIDISKLISKMNEFETPEEWRQFTAPIHNWFNNNTDQQKKVLVEKLSSYIEDKLIETEGKIINQGVLIFKEQFIYKK